MSWWGKLIGGAFGYMIGGPLGALIGAAMGHNFDRGLQVQRQNADPGAQERVQTAFFTATFAVMGHVAKADGRVSAAEIQLAEAVMEHMRLDGEMRRAAMGLFGEGKQSGFPLDDVLDQLRRECQGRRNLLRMFMEIQLQAAYADGSLDAAEARLLERICRQLGISTFEYRQLEAMVRAARHFAGGGAGPRGPSTPSRDRVAEAYAVLGVAPDASDAEVKRAYRRLMNQHHPDKLVAKGLPEEMMKLATEKTQEIKAAYDTVRSAREG